MLSRLLARRQFSRARACTLWLTLGIGLFPAGTSSGGEDAAAVTLAWESEPRTIDPRFAQDANAQYLENLLHCSLVQYDKDGRLAGWLATSWTWKSSTTLEMVLRTDAVFGDGTQVTAKDVQATYLFFQKGDLKKPSPRRGAFSKLRSVTALKDDTLVFELAEPDAAFVSNLVVGILPAKWAERDMITDQDQVFGCGPFVLQKMDQGRIDLVPNPKYSLSDKPKVGRVTIKIVKDENTRYAKLQAGEVDIVQNLLSRDKVANLSKKNPALHILHRQGQATTYVGFHMKDPIVGQLAVRQAIAQAIDRDKIVKYILRGMATPAQALLPPNDPFFNSMVPGPTYDPKAAMATLDQAGLKDPDGPTGRLPRFTLTLKTTTDLTRISIAKAIASELKKIGIAVQVEALEWGRFKADVDAGRVQMWTLSWIGFKDPDIYRYAFATESFPPTGGNRGFYSNAALDQLLAKGKAEPDFKTRQAVYSEVQALVARDLPYVFLWHDEIFAVVSRRVSGFEVYADGRLASLAHVSVVAK